MNSDHLLIEERKMRNLVIFLPNNYFWLQIPPFKLEVKIPHCRSEMMPLTLYSRPEIPLWTPSLLTRSQLEALLAAGLNFYPLSTPSLTSSPLLTGLEKTLRPGNISLDSLYVLSLSM
jgi:hypothetical protein